MTDVLIEAGRLAAEGKPFALATVVNVERPVSARRGDRALVTPDGELRGWVGGSCTEPTVVREALGALADGEPRLVRVEKGCASEGTVEVLVEPQLPAPLLAVVGDSPCARTLTELARILGWRVATASNSLLLADAVVVASMGQDDEDALAEALSAGVGYVGLVASAKRAAAVTETLRERRLSEDRLARLRSPAGLDLGPSSQPEIAVAILAELVAWRHLQRPRVSNSLLLEEAVDPICGMSVAVEGARHTLVYEGETYYFCGPGCQRRFEAAHV